MKILIVDDNAAFSDMLAVRLMDFEILSVVAENGWAAMEALREGLMPDLIVLDLEMPIMNGRTFIEQKQSEKKFAQIPVIVCSGDVSRHLGLEGAVAAIFDKVDFEDVVAIVVAMRDNELAK